MTETNSETDVAALAVSFAGEILTPADGARFDQTRAVFNAMFDRRPGAIARATCDGDVIAAILFAQSAPMPLAVRAGGHSVAGYSTIEGGLLLDLRPMNSIDIDRQARTVRVGPGATWGELDAATQAHGLATTGGRMTTTGVAGFVLGSGSGWLERMHGLACDNLISARVVTAGGRVVTASESENQELFWGLRGGGGNFGVVTEFELRLYPVGPTIFGGLRLYPVDQAVTVARGFRDVVSAAPPELAGGLVFGTAPPAPFVPAELHGKPAVSLVLAWLGDPEMGADALVPLLDLGEPAADLVGPISYCDLQAITDPGNPTGRRHYWTSDLLAELGDDTIDAVVEQATAATSPFSVIIVAPSGGAVDAVPEDHTPIGGRSAPWFYHCYGTWTQGADVDHITWVKDTGSALRPWTTVGMALNFFTDVNHDRVLSAFGEAKYRRLQAIKDRYDPDNLFCRNQNIRPSA